MTTRNKYPDHTLPTWLRQLRDKGTEASALSALLAAPDARTAEIAKERLDVLRGEPLPPPPWRGAMPGCPHCDNPLREQGGFKPLRCGACGREYRRSELPR